MTAPTAGVKLARPAKFRGYDHQRLLKQFAPLHIQDQRGQSPIQILNQQMLLELPFVVSIPTRAIEEIQIEGNFNKSDAPLHQSPRQQASLSKLRPVRIPQLSRFLSQIKCAHELRPGDTESLPADGRLSGYIRVGAVGLLVSLLPFLQQPFTARLTLIAYVRRRDQAIWSSFN